MRIFYSFFLPTSRFIWKVNINVPAKPKAVRA